jgi:hypothetical protein
MNASSLPAAIRAAAEGICTLEAAAGLVIAHGTWLGRDDFARFIHHGTDTAAINWEAAISALDAGGLPCSAGEKRMLRLAASLAGQATISLGEAVTGIDDRNCDLLIKSVWHAAGRRQFS